MPDAHYIVLRNHLDEVQRLSEWLRDRAEHLQLDKANVFKVNLILEEAVTNIIQHGCADEDAHEIVVKLTHNGPSITVRVEDDGIPFDPTGHPTPEMADSLGEATEGGMGIHLMRTYATDLSYQHSGGRNILTATVEG